MKKRLATLMAGGLLWMPGAVMAKDAPTAVRPTTTQTEPVDPDSPKSAAAPVDTRPATAVAYGISPLAIGVGVVSIAGLLIGFLALSNTAGRPDMAPTAT